MSDEDFPRVLVVGHAPFSHGTGTALTLSNLFSGWPKARLGQIYTATRTPTTEICENYFSYPPVDHYPALQYYPMRLLGWNGHSPMGQSRAVATMESAADRRPVLRKIYTHLRTSADLSPIKLTPALMEWVRQFRPDVVYSMLGSVRLTRFAAEVARAAGVPVVPHFTDDWPATLYANGQLLGLADRVARHTIDRLIHHAPLGMVISQPMADEYTRRYHIPFHVFANCVDNTYFHTPHHPTHQPPTIQLTYVGALHLNRWEPLRDIATALHTITTNGQPAQLTIHTPTDDLNRYGKHLTDLPHTHLGPPLETHQVPTALQNSTILIHVESSNPDIRRYTHYSVSTKIPQYLAAARPILGYGPTNLASMNHIRTANAGLTADTPTTLLHQLTTLCHNPQLRHHLAHNGTTYAHQHHTQQNVATRFATTLKTATQKPAHPPAPHYPTQGKTEVTA